MIKILRIFLLLFLCHLSIAIIAQEQYLNFRINSTINNNISPNFIIDTNSYIKYGQIQVNSSIPNIMEFYSIAKDSICSVFKIKLENKSANDLLAGYEEDINNNFYGFKFRHDSVWMKSKTTETFLSSYGITDSFELAVCKTQMAFYKNLNQVTIITDTFINSAKALLKLYSQSDPSGYVSYRYESNCIITPPPQLDTIANYFEVSTKPNGNHAFLSVFNNGTKYLRFYYKEKYNIVAGNNDTVRCTLYDESRNSLYKVNQANNYGSNFKIIDITNYTVHGKLYLLEVANINKNEKYYLKFEY